MAAEEPASPAPAEPERKSRQEERGSALQASLLVELSPSRVVTLNLLVLWPDSLNTPGWSAERRHSRPTPQKQGLVVREVRGSASETLPPLEERRQSER